jgi:hypothetical protein
MDRDLREEDEMSTQTIRYQERKTYGSWRYAVLALVIAIAFAIAIATASGGQTTGGPTGGAQVAPRTGPQPTLHVASGPAAGHPLP